MRSWSNLSPHTPRIHISSFSPRFSHFSSRMLIFQVRATCTMHQSTCPSPIHIVKEGQSVTLLAGITALFYNGINVADGRLRGLKITLEKNLREKNESCVVSLCCGTPFQYFRWYLDTSRRAERCRGNQQRIRCEYPVRIRLPGGLPE